MALSPCSTPARAATWNGTGADNLWQDGNNWVGATPPVPSITEVLVFGGTTQLTNVNDFAAGSQFNTIMFSAGAGAFNLTGNSIVLGNGAAGTKITNSSSILQSIDFDIDLGPTAGIATTVAGGVAGIRLTGDISGAANLASTGSVTLAGTNTHTGTTTIGSGATVTLEGAGSMSNNSVLTTSFTNTTPGTVQLRSDAGATFGAAGVTFAGVSQARSLNVDVGALSTGLNQTLTLGGTFAFTSYTSGPTTLNVTGSNGYKLALGPVTVAPGSSGNNGVIVNANADVDIASVTIPGTASSTSMTFTGASDINILGDLVRTTTSRSLAMTVSMDPTGSLTLSGAAATASATTANGYRFNLNSGTLNINNAGAIGVAGNATKSLNIFGGAIDNTSGAPITASAGNTAINIEGDFTYGGTNSLNLGTGVTTLGVSAGTTRVITTNGTGTLTLGGIANGTTANSLTKAGSGHLLVASNAPTTFTGTTTVVGGMLELASLNALGATTDVQLLGGNITLSGTDFNTDRINNLATMTLAGGTFATGGLDEGPIDGAAGGPAGIGALSITAPSIIDFGNIASPTSGSSILFASLASFTGSLTVLNWTSTSAPGTDDGNPFNDRLLFEFPTNLDAGQLANISFYDDSGAFLGTAAQFTYNGYTELVVTAVPEPSTWAMLGGGAAMLFCQMARRRRAYAQAA